MVEIYHNHQISMFDDFSEKTDPPSCVSDLLTDCPKNGEIQSTMVKFFDNIQDHDKIMCSVSGGYDSDIMMDLIIRCGGREKTVIVFNDTGLEYDATKEHIAYLEERYGVDIIRLKPQKAIPNCVLEHGVPFWSKYVSSMISRLQKHGFQWDDDPLEDLLDHYPNCKAALRWWCNDYKTESGRVSKFNIEWTHGLKEFMILSPPEFKISAQCCEWSKKKPTRDFLVSGEFDLNCTGIRKAEGGQRSTTYKSCFDKAMGEADNYRPLFWWTNQDKETYRRHYNIVRSDCYEVWGMDRTGCSGCPFSKELEEELDLARTFEPKRYSAMMSVFGKSYDYTRRFLAFRENLKIKSKENNKKQIELKEFM